MFACLYSPSIPHDALERIARSFSPRIEYPSASMVMLDVSGLERLLGPPEAIAAELSNACAATSTDRAAVAIAGTRVAAQLLAQCGGQVTHIVAPGEEAAALAALPVDVLLHVGAPPDLVATLERWGLRTLQSFAGLPSPALASRIGQPGLVWQHVARGEDARPLVPAPVEERFEGLVDLEWPIDGIEPLAFILGGLLDSLCTRLEMRDRAVAVIELRLRLAVSRTWHLRRLELPAPMRDPRMLRTLLCLNLEGQPIGAGRAGRAGETGGTGGAGENDGREAIGSSIDRVGVFIEPTPAPVIQHSLLARPGLDSMTPEVVATLMARLGALMGQDRCGRARLLDTHRPDAFVMEPFTGAAGPTGRVTSNASRRALRRLRHPIPARVVVEHGRPSRVTTDRRGWSGGRVVWCAGPWRASGDWWSVLYRRQEWDVSLSDHASYRIHEDRLRRRWFIDAILD